MAATAIRELPSATASSFVGTGRSRATVAPTAASAGAGPLLAGAGFAAVFPVILSYVGDRYERLSGTAFGVVFVMALTGGTVLPYVTGVLADVAGFRASLTLVPGSIVCVVLVFAVARARLRAPPSVTV